jgi:hypothetical protein
MAETSVIAVLRRIGEALFHEDGDDAVETLHYGTRRALWVVAVVAGSVALLHQPFADAVAASHDRGVLGTAHDVLMWPVPLAQPVLAGVGAFVLTLVGVQSGGWRRVTRRQYSWLLPCTTAAILGAGPTVLVCMVTVAVIALAVMIGLLIFLFLLVLLIVAR